MTVVVFYLLTALHVKKQHKYFSDGTPVSTQRRPAQ